MKLEALLTAAWLASTATAIGPASPNQTQRLNGKPEKMANWRWPNPFTSPRHKKFSAACEAERTFPAQEFLLDDLGESGATGLIAYRDALKSVFAAREYPGSWDGIDPHGYDRTLLTMDYEVMPLKVREWIEEQERTDGPGRGLFAVYGRPMPGTRVLNTIRVPEEVPVSKEWRDRDDTRVALFAPGAIYEVLPLWVAEGSKCEGGLSPHCLNRDSDRVLTCSQMRCSTSPSTAPSWSTAASLRTRCSTLSRSGRRASATLSSRSRRRC
jgi:hypothetical protein